MRGLKRQLACSGGDSALRRCSALLPHLAAARDQKRPMSGLTASRHSPEPPPPPPAAALAPLRSLRKMGPDPCCLIRRERGERAGAVLTGGSDGDQYHGASHGEVSLGIRGRVTLQQRFMTPTVRDVEEGQDAVAFLCESTSLPAADERRCGRTGIRMSLSGSVTGPTSLFTLTRLSRQKKICRIFTR